MIASHYILFSAVCKENEKKQAEPENGSAYLYFCMGMGENYRRRLPR